MIIRHTFPSQKIKFWVKKIIGSQQSMMANTSRTYVKQNIWWEELWFVKCVLKLFLIASPFSTMKNNSIKLPKLESLIVSEVRNLYNNFFCVHLNLAIQEAPAILAESIISSIIKKRTNQTPCEIPTTKGVNWCLLLWYSCHQCNKLSMSSVVRSPLYLKNLDQGWSSRVFFCFLYINRCLTIEFFIKEMYNWRSSLRLFTSNCYREQIKFIQIEAKKKRDSCLAPIWNEIFLMFTLTSQCRLLELLSSPPTHFWLRLDSNMAS